MSDFLAKIIEYKKEEIKAAAGYRSEESLRREAEGRGGDGRRGFFGRLSKPGPLGINVIAEIKRASPSKGPIRSDADPARFAAMYEQGGAAAISVLTDANFFGGSPADLRAARSAAGLPVLRKDFLISSYQIYESAAMGADAILLIVRALSSGLLKDLIALAEDLGIDALVEAHDASEFEAAARAGARLIGINNRDLKTFKTDINTSIEIARMAIEPPFSKGGQGGFSGPVLVSESGIHGRAEIERLAEAGITNFLIGESIMRADDPVRFLKILHGERP